MECDTMTPSYGIGNPNAVNSKNKQPNTGMFGHAVVIVCASGVVQKFVSTVSSKTNKVGQFNFGKNKNHTGKSLYKPSTVNVFNFGQTEMHTGTILPKHTTVNGDTFRHLIFYQENTEQIRSKMKEANNFKMLIKTFAHVRKIARLRLYYILIY